MILHTYPSIFNLGHKAIQDLTKGPVIVEEKVDGSQFSFSKLASTGEIVCRSKGAAINMQAPEGMFIRAVEVVTALAPLLTPGFVYRGEYLKSAKHNVMAYDRHPNNHIILFDITWGDEAYCPRAEKEDEARRLGLEIVPLLFEGMLTDETLLRTLLDTTSVLGAQKIEGVVIKRAAYDLFGRDKKVLFGKFVSEAFRENHAKDWKQEHGQKSCGDIIQLLASQYGLPGRFAKALIHLKEGGTIENSPKDIGALIAEIPNDIQKECEEDIKTKLWNWAWPQLRRAVTKGVPQWYKDKLMTDQFTTAPDHCAQPAPQAGVPGSTAVTTITTPWSGETTPAQEVAVA